MSQIQLSVSAVFDRAWELTKKHWLLLIAFNILIMIVNEVLTTPFTAQLQFAQLQANVANMSPEEMMEIVAPIYLSLLAWSPLLSIIAFALRTGYLKMYLNVTQDKAPELNAYALPVMSYVNFVVVSLIVEIIVSLGLACCVVPGVFLAVRLQYAPLAVLDDPKCTIMEAVNRSWKMTDGNFWNLFLVGLACFGLILLGLLCCCVGVFFTCVICYCAYAVSYRMLSAEAPFAGTAEYNRSER